MDTILLKGARLVGGRKCDILIEGERIASIADSIVSEGCKVLDCSNFYALPGLYNMHTHAAMTLVRGVGKGETLHNWLQQIWDIEDHLDEEAVYWGTKLAALEMIKGGTTCFADMYWMIPSAMKAVDEMGLRASLSYVLLDGGDMDKAMRQRDECEKVAAMAASWPEKVAFSLAIHADYTVCDENMKWAADFASKHKVKVQAHLSETEKEMRDTIAKYGFSPVVHFDRYGLINKDFIAAHGLWLSDTDIETLGSRGATVVHNINSNLMLSSGYKFKYKELRDAGANVCIGTDGAASSDNLDIRESMKTMLLLQWAWRRDPKAFPLEELLEVATCNGARALGIDAGRIEEGALADIALIDVRKPAFVPDFNFLSNYVLAADSSCVDTLICGGRILMENRKVEGEEEILAETEKQARRLMKKACGKA
ncbi:MAG: amidohydrolase [Bacteroidales bacterium]|nr:amidohydrolase [Bacteroidales bacterium]